MTMMTRRRQFWHSRDRAHAKCTHNKHTPRMQKQQLLLLLMQFERCNERTRRRRPKPSIHHGHFLISLSLPFPFPSQLPYCLTPHNTLTNYTRRFLYGSSYKLCSFLSFPLCTFSARPARRSISALVFTSFRTGSYLFLMAMGYLLGNQLSITCSHTHTVRALCNWEWVFAPAAVAAAPKELSSDTQNLLLDTSKGRTKKPATLYKEVFGSL